MGGFLALKIEVKCSDSERDSARSHARVSRQAWGSIRGQALEEVEAVGREQTEGQEERGAQTWWGGWHGDHPF